MTGPDQWYYVEGSETRGPVAAAEIVRLVQSGKLSPTAPVAQAGAQSWTPASAGLAHLLAPTPPQAALEAGQIYAVKVQCISGPDTGKAYMISAQEVALGHVSGLTDPQVAANHLGLAWHNNLLHFRTFGNSMLRIDGQYLNHGALANGQQFSMGASVWQVGTVPLELGNVLEKLSSRLNRLTNTEKLEGFSLVNMFSEVFKGRKPGELEEYFLVGTSKTTPPLDQVQTGWPQPWFFMRVLIFLAVVYGCFYAMFDTLGNPNAVPGLMVMGAAVVPLAMVFLFWEMNTPRNISFHTVLVLVCLGGTISLLVSLIGYDVSNLDWLGIAQAGIVEEVGKLLAVVLVCALGARNTRYRWILNGMVFGAAIGGGFALFETAGYAFFHGFLKNLTTNLVANDGKMPMDQMLPQLLTYAYQAMLHQIHGRAWTVPFGHILWTAISAGALWRVKGNQRFRAAMLFDPTFLRVFAIPVVAHGLWDAPVFEFSQAAVDMKYIVLGIVGWYVAFTLIQQGLRQIREAQVSATKSEYEQTQEILTTTGRFRSQQLV